MQSSCLDRQAGHDRILPLPDHAVAQIKSSTAIVSLPAVVIALVENSLDAKATKINLTLDFARGACTVEDNGLGIAPIEFREEGGLGKLYSTSKHKPTQPLLGRHGTFLASLSSVSLLSIASRHYQYRSTNSITFHHANPIQRHLPALSHHDIHDKHGTRVTVRNLFGNLPVRVKQRARILEKRSETDRLWNLVKTNVLGLLLSWTGSVSLRARDAENCVIFSFNTSDSTEVIPTSRPDTSKSRSAHLTSVLNLLTQANHVSVDQWPSWIPASASTSAFSIRGAISLDPAPTKNTQFISLGPRPLLAESKYNELYDEVNRIFKLSSFGAIHDDTIEYLEKVSQSIDVRVRPHTHTNRKLQVRKGVDKYPMFYLQISLRDGLVQSLHEIQFIDDKTNIQTVIEVLSAMIMQWLSTHHFCPIQSRQMRNRVENPSIAHAESSECSASASLPINASGCLSRAVPSTSTKTTKPLTGKRKRSSIPGSREYNEQPLNHAFARWSRIKSGKSEFFTNPSASAFQSNGDKENLIYRSKPTAFASFSTQSNSHSALNTQRLQDDENSPNDTVAEVDGLDGSIIWTDPLTKKRHLLNARTGCAMRPTSNKHDKNTILSALGVPQNCPFTSLRLPPKPTTNGKASWLQDVIHTWENPVFKSSEKRIEQLFVPDDEHDGAVRPHERHQCSRIDPQKKFIGLPLTGATKLSKEDLLDADVIAQVDKKFILIKVTKSSPTTLHQTASTATLVLIDQHAADERVQVENLFQQLCTPAVPSYQSSLGHTTPIATTLLTKSIQFTVSPQEQTHFATHATRFASWGILFDILGPPILSETENANTKPQPRLSITSLPPTIIERCKSDIPLLVSFIRSTLYTYIEGPHISPSTPLPTTEPAGWVRNLATCPAGLVDLINSRACRSAIMFNDELDLGQCRELVRSLAGCVFPFMCAHGRPSLVPLGDVGGFGGRAEATRGFVEGWRGWKM
ncbi:DNA mismatch repair protein [Phaeosphaeriaceae sp. PMI808]|nr:DNA mismatch repair protein [Phaeosphaeriaceae sp. PMI808]